MIRFGLVIDGRLARIEAGNGYSTKGVPVQPGQWHHAAVVKFGSKLSLYVDGDQKSTVEVPDTHYECQRFLRWEAILILLETNMWRSIYRSYDFTPARSLLKRSRR